MAGTSAAGSVSRRCPVTPIRNENGSCPSPSGGHPGPPPPVTRPPGSGSWRVIGHIPAWPAGTARCSGASPAGVRPCPDVVQATLTHCAGARLSWVSTPSPVRLLPSVTVTRLRPPGVNAIVVCWYGEALPIGKTPSRCPDPRSVMTPRPSARSPATRIWPAAGPWADRDVPVVPRRPGLDGADQPGAVRVAQVDVAVLPLEDQARTRSRPARRPSPRGPARSAWWSG